MSKRSGIKFRHFVSKDESTSDMAVNASFNAIKNAKIKKEDIDLNSRIGMMQKTKTFNWEDLADNPRVIETKQIIKTLGEI